jgi:hypothetical protein
MRGFVVPLATVVALGGMVATACAQGPGQGPVAKECATEISQYCAGMSHGAGKVRACLRAHAKELSQSCRYALDHTGHGRGRNTP